MAPKQHARLGASKAHRWMSCPGSVRLSEGIEETTSAYAEEGTRAHNLAELCLITEGNPGVGAGELGEISEEMAEAVQVYVDYVRQRAVGGELRVEQQFDLAPLSPPEEMYGTADAVVWHEDTGTLEVIDLKYGRGVVVEVRENPQLRMYALGAVVALCKRPKKIVITIVQPRAYHPDGAVRSEEITWEELVEFKRELFNAAVACQDPDAPLSAGDHCTFCPALATCPAQRSHATALAQAEFEVLAVEGDLALPMPDQLTDEQLSAILAGSDLVTAWLAAVRQHVHARLLRGEEVPGWKLVEGRKGNRKWTDEEAVAKYLARKKIKKKDRVTEKLVSPAQAEKILRKIGVELPQKFVTRSDGAPSLAPADDPRPALPAAVDVEFEVLAPTLEEA